MGELAEATATLPWRPAPALGVGRRLIWRGRAAVSCPRAKKTTPAALQSTGRSLFCATRPRPHTPNKSRGERWGIGSDRLVAVIAVCGIELMPAEAGCRAPARGRHSLRHPRNPLLGDDLIILIVATGAGTLTDKVPVARSAAPGESPREGIRGLAIPPLASIFVAPLRPPPGPGTRCGHRPQLMLRLPHDSS
jgi:hypothetical protein